MCASKKDKSIQKLPFKIFICHKSSENSSRAKKLKRILEVDGALRDRIQIYMSTTEHEIITGWHEKVHNELDEADMLLYIYSHDSPPTDKDYCNYEAGYFAKKDEHPNIKVVVPDNVYPPLPFMRYQCFSLNEEGIKDLLREIWVFHYVYQEIFEYEYKDKLEKKVKEILRLFTQEEEEDGFNRIFLSYRRQDSEDVTGRIYDRLIGYFGKSAVFKDVDSIPLGIDFRAHIKNQLENCEYFLAVIGKKWLDITDEKGQRRLLDEKDYVKIETQTAINMGISIIPILVRGAKVPQETELPDDIKDLSYRNGLSIRPDPDFHQDMDRLIKRIVQ